MLKHSLAIAYRLVVLVSTAGLLGTTACSKEKVLDNHSPTAPLDPATPSTVTVPRPATIASTAELTIVVSTTEITTPSATTSATPTPTRRATPTPQAPPTLAAAMRLADAEAEVLSWIDGHHQPRIERSFYVTEAEAYDAKPDSLPHHWFTPSEINPPKNAFPDPESQRLLVVVEVSNQGIDIFHQAGQHAGQTPSSGNQELVWPGGACIPVPAARRQRVIAIFEAETGHYIGGGPITPYHGIDEALDRLFLSARSSVEGLALLSTPRATSTRKPTASSQQSDTGSRPLPALPKDADPPRELALGEIPSGLEEVVREYPLLLGSRWVYQVTSHHNNLRWKRWTFTSTIEAAWQVAPDVMMIRERREASAKGRDPLPWTVNEDGYQFVFPNGIAGELETATLAQAREDLQSTPIAYNSREYNWPRLTIRDVLKIPIQTPERLDYWREIQSKSAISGPSGSFEDCVIVRDIINAGNSSAAWLCSGVGYVRFEYPGCSAMYGSHIVMELIDYSIPER